MNILQTFYILFKSDAEKVQRETQAAERSAESLAAAVDAVGVAHEAAATAAVEGAGATAAANLEATASIEELRRAQVLAAAAATAARRVALESATEENIAVATETASVLKLAAARVAEAEAAEKAARAEGHLGGAYVFNRMQRQELLGIGRHSLDQLASGGSLLRVVSSHASSLAEAMSMGEGGLAAGFAALGSAVVRFARVWGLPLAAIGTFVAGIGIAKGAVKDLENTRLMAARVNMDVSDYDALNKVVRRLGGDTKETDRDLERFANRIDDAFGGKTLGDGKDDRISKTLKLIHVSARDANGQLKDTKTALLDVAGALESMSAAKKSETLRNLGFSSPRHGQTDPAIEKLLTGGRAAMLEYIETEKRLGGVTKEQVEAAHKYKVAVEILDDRFRDLRNTIAERILPILTSLVSGIRSVIEWVRLNSTLVQGFAVGFLAAATVVTAAIWGKLIPAFSALALRVLLATWPFVLAAVAIAALGFAFATAWEDVQFFLKGQPSLLGELVNKYEWVRKTVNAIGDAFRWIGKEGRDLWRGVIDGAKAFGSWAAPFFKGLAEILRPIASLFLDIGKAILKAFGPTVITALKIAILLPLELVKQTISAFGQIAGLIGKGFALAAKYIGPIWDQMFQGWLKQLYLLIAGVRTLLGLRPDLAVNRSLQPAASGVGAAQTALAAAHRTPLAAQTPVSMAHHARTQHKTTHVHVDKIDVNTQATDPDGIARAMAGSLSTEMRRATDNFDDGVDR